MTTAQLTLIVDRSGSMISTRKDAEGGIKAFFDEQREVSDTDISVSIHQFDNEFETVVDNVPLRDYTSDYVLRPRGGTALRDAIGNGIMRTPMGADKTVVVIVTDGWENASREWTDDMVKKLVEDRKEQGWEFVFLGADLSSIHMATGVGLKSTQYNATSQGTGSTYAVTRKSVSSYLAGETQTIVMPDKVEDQ